MLHKVLTKFILAHGVRLNTFGLAVLASLSAPVTGLAASFDYGGTAGFERFTWEEFDLDGSQLLKESGTRQLISGFIGNTLVAKNHFIYNAEAKMYFGTVNYDGGTIPTAGQPSSPVQSDTSYTGLNVKGEAGYRAGKIDSAFTWDFVGGAGVDNWVREIASSTAANGQAVGKAQEQYTILNLRVGTGPNWQAGQWQGRLIVGLKYPLATNEYVDKQYTNYDRDLNLEPKGRISPYLNFYNNIKLSDRIWLTFDAFYDSYRFDHSDFVEVFDYYDGQTKYAFQPESKQETYGLQAGVVISY